MLLGDKLWVGTGGGRVLILSYAPNVPDVEESIRVLAKHKSASDAEITASTRSVDAGGLLTPTADTDQSAPPSATTPDNEKWVHLEGEGSSHSPAPSGRTYYQKRRRTQFGKTLRNKTQKQKQSQDDIYALSFLSCSDVVTAANESVRVLIPLRSV